MSIFFQIAMKFVPKGPFNNKPSIMIQFIDT